LIADATLLALRPSRTRFTVLAVLEFAQPGLNSRLERRDFRFKLSNNRGALRLHEFDMTLPCMLLPLQRLGETDAPSVKE
jgi:hypothetical protein